MDHVFIEKETLNMILNMIKSIKPKLLSLIKPG